MGTAFAIVLIIHGLAHLVGFVLPWRVAAPPEAPAKTTILGDTVDLGNRGIRVLGIVWLATAALFVVAGIALMTGRPWWIELTGGTAAFSLVLCVLGWPDAKLGIPVNVGVLAFVLAIGRFGWLGL